MTQLSGNFLSLKDSYDMVIPALQKRVEICPDHSAIAGYLGQVDLK